MLDKKRGEFLKCWVNWLFSLFLLFWFEWVFDYRVVEFIYVNLEEFRSVFDKFGIGFDKEL